MKGSNKRTTPNAENFKKPISEKEKTDGGIEESLIQREELLIIEESSDVISKIINSIKSSIVFGSIITFLWTIMGKGPESLPGSVLDKSPWIKDKHLEYGNKEKENDEELGYVPIIRRELKEITAYVPEDPRQTDSDPDNASCGRYDYLVKKGINIIAVSQDIFFDEKAKRMLKREKPLCGLPAVIKLKSGEEVKGVIMDTMNPRFKNKADLGISVYQYGGSLEKANEEALKFGKQEAKELIVFLPIKKEALLEGIVKERIKGKLKRILESFLGKGDSFFKKS